MNRLKRFVLLLASAGALALLSNCAPYAYGGGYYRGPAYYGGGYYRGPYAYGPGPAYGYGYRPGPYFGGGYGYGPRPEFRGRGFPRGPGFGNRFRGPNFYRGRRH
jgi:hypothetical protein